MTCTAWWNAFVFNCGVTITKLVRVILQIIGACNYTASQIERDEGKRKNQLVRLHILSFSFKRMTKNGNKYYRNDHGTDFPLNWMEFGNIQLDSSFGFRAQHSPHGCFGANWVACWFWLRKTQCVPIWSSIWLRIEVSVGMSGSSFGLGLLPSRCP